MTLDDMIAQAAGLLGVQGLKPLMKGGQKAVLSGVGPEQAPVALKVVEIGGDANALKRARREVELLASIASDYVVKVRSAPVELGSPPIGIAWLEELLPGHDLVDDLFKAKWPWADVRQLALCIGAGLDAFHSRNVVHRDLSPRNVRDVGNKVFKVIDPGFARHVGKSTLTGTFQPGTPNFVSPEHVTPGAKPVPASDVFAAGILFYAALTGGVPVPFQGDAVAYIAALQQAAHVPLSQLRPDVDANVVAFVERCLHRQSARRFLNGAELLRAVP